MSEPGKFSLEKLVASAPRRPATLIAALLALIAALFLTKESITEIPELVETSYGYDNQLRATLKNRSIGASSLPVTFVDVDDAAINAWGDATRTTPREKLADLVRTIAAKQPSLIFVDFDLSGVSPNDGDAKLDDVLEKYSKTAPPLLVTRVIRPAECHHGKCDSKICESEHGGGLSPSPFEKVTSGKDNVYWVSSVFTPDSDGVVRSWRLWETFCSDGALTTLPSAQLVAVALVGPSAPGREKLAKYMLAVGDHAPAGAAADKLDWPRNVEARDALIPFLIGGSSNSPVSDWLGSAGFRYQRVRAQSLLLDQVAESAIKDRVVVIGASYGADKLKTPLGVMPGAALLANAIAVAPSILDTPPNHPALRMLLTLILAACYGAIAKQLRPIPAAVAIAALSYVWLSIATYILNPADAVSTVGLALIVLGAFLALESFIEIVIDVINGEGWSALMRKRGPGH